MITVAGVFAALAHTLGAAACWKARGAAHGPMRRFAAFWLALSVAFAVLAGLEFLGLPEAVRKALKLMAKASGHYGERRGFQAELLAGGALVGGVLVLLAVFAAHRALKNDACSRLVALAATALAGHLTLLGLRIVSLHAIDVIFALTRANWILFVVFSAMVVIAALRFVRRAPVGRDSYSRESRNRDWRR